MILQKKLSFGAFNLRLSFAQPSLNLRCGIAVQNGTFGVGIKTKFARLLIILYLCALDLINYKNGRRNIQSARKCCLFGR